MKAIVQFILILFVGGVSLSVWATTYYVDAGQFDDSADGLSWETAKQSIQAAVDLSVDGDTVLVTNGVYVSGSRATSSYADGWPNRVLIDKAITVQSVNGPDCTTIDGRDTVRSVYLDAEARLDGFTITGGRTSLDDSLDTQRRGGGILARSLGGYSTITNCVITDNAASLQGGGAYLSNATLQNCDIAENHSYGMGGGLGLYNSTVTFCTLSKNSAVSQGGGFSAVGSNISCCKIDDNTSNWKAGACLLENDSTLNSSIISYNHSDYGAAIEFFNGGALNFCTVVYNWSNGIGDGFDEVDSCIIYDNHGVDIPVVSPAIHHSCSTNLVHGANNNITNAPGFRMDRVRLDYDSPCRGAGEYASDIPYDFEGNPRSIGAIDMGAYEAAPMVFVDGNFTPDDSGDGYTLATAKRTLQAGADTAHALLTNYSNLAFAELWVKPIPNGSYQEGGAAAPDSMQLLNRLAVSSNIWVYAVAGSFSAPVIDGGNSMRCVYLGENSRLEGFTLQNGKTDPAGLYTDVDGGGALIEKNALIKDCTIQSNYAGSCGGGVFLRSKSAMTDCILTANESEWSGGGAYLESQAAMSDCEFVRNISQQSGGGARLLNATAVNCTLNYNTATKQGGGLFLDESSAEGCSLLLNEAKIGGGCYLEASDLTDGVIRSCDTTLDGGGVYATNSTLASCTLQYNSAGGDGGGIFLVGDSILLNSEVSSNESLDQGGGVYAGETAQIDRCIVDDNEAETGGGVYLNGTSVTEYPSVNQALIHHNTAHQNEGAGLYLHSNGELRNCTIAANYGIGLNLYLEKSRLDLNPGGKVYNSIVWANRDGDIDTFGPSIIRNTCAGDGVEHLVDNCLAINPRFYGGSDPYLLSSKSPCLDYADEQYVISATDLAGNPRSHQGGADLGAYENIYGAQTSDTDLDGLPDSWETNYYAAVSQCARDADTDNDGYSNWEEYMAGTNPTNRQSHITFSIQGTSDGNVQLQWGMNSQESRLYCIERTLSLSEEFTAYRSSTTASNRVIRVAPYDEMGVECIPPTNAYYRLVIKYPNEPQL